MWQFLRRICNQTTLSLQATQDTPDIADTYESETDTSFLPDAAVSYFSGSGISWFDNVHIPTDITICWLPYWFLNRESRRQGLISTDAHWRVKEVSNPSSVYYLSDISIEDTNQWVTGTVRVCFKSATSIFTYHSIKRSINGHNKWEEEHISSTSDIRTH